VIKETPGPGQESVWDYPRPPRIEPEPREVRVVFAGRVVVETGRALRVLETSHPPGIYVPFEDVAPGVLVPNPRRSVCEWKGTARYWDLQVGDQVAAAAVWGYPRPRHGFEALAGHVSFYPAPMDACHLGGEPVTPQPGGFYGGWITSDVVGPFKGGPGTLGW
jgi:uncharacterized protein (DUF427 family)